MKLEKCKTNRYWAGREDNGMLICQTVYKVGGLEVLRRLSAIRLESKKKAGKEGDNGSELFIYLKQRKKDRICPRITPFDCMENY